MIANHQGDATELSLRLLLGLLSAARCRAAISSRARRFASILT